MVIKVSDYSASVAQLLGVYFAFLIAPIKKLSVKVTFNFSCSKLVTQFLAVVA